MSSRGRYSLLLVLAGCQMMPSALRPASPGNRPYVNRDAHFSLRVPAGWDTPGPGNLFKKPPYLVRFEAVNGAVSATVTRVPLGQQSCAEAGRAALKSPGGALVRSEQSFRLKAPAGDLPAWRASFQTADGARRGEASLFCEGSSAILLAVAADKSAYDDYQSQLAAVVESFGYYDGEREVKVRPESAPPPTPEYFRHRVRWRGQTLSQVAQWYTGNSENWTKLVAPVNEDLKAADVPLKVGREVRIPVELVIQKEPMPEPRTPRPASRPVARPPVAAAPAEPPPPAKAALPEAEEAPDRGGGAPEPEVPLPDVIGPK